MPTRRTSSIRVPAVPAKNGCFSDQFTGSRTTTEGIILDQYKAQTINWVTNLLVGLAEEDVDVEVLEVVVVDVVVVVDEDLVVVVVELVLEDEEEVVEVFDVVLLVAVVVVVTCRL